MSEEIISIPLTPNDVPTGPTAAAETTPERAPQAQCPIIGISITVTDDIPGGLPPVRDFTAALLMTLKLAVDHGGREIQLHHVRKGWENEPHTGSEGCGCKPLVFRAEPATRLILARG